jgi:hypothetical protein
MILEVKKVYTTVHSLENVIAFFRHTLGAQYSDDQFSGNQTAMPYNTNNGLHIILQNHSQADGHNEITIVTSDCISDYCQLKAIGIFFTKSPDYVSAGLAAEFVDDAGNIYSLLEERNYQQNFLLHQDI